MSINRMAQVVGILHRGKRWSLHLAVSMPWLLKTLRPNEPGQGASIRDIGLHILLRVRLLISYHIIHHLAGTLQSCYYKLCLRCPPYYYNSMGNKSNIGITDTAFGSRSLWASLTRIRKIYFVIPLEMSHS